MCRYFMMLHLRIQMSTACAAAAKSTCTSMSLEVQRIESQTQTAFLWSISSFLGSQMHWFPSLHNISRCERARPENAIKDTLEYHFFGQCPDLIVHTFSRISAAWKCESSFRDRAPPDVFMVLLLDLKLIKSGFLSWFL